MTRAIPLASTGPGPVRRIDVSTAPWRWRTVLEAPHRVAFTAGSLMLAVSALWWLAVIVGRSVPALASGFAVAPGAAHAVLMVFGFMPLFFTGFLFTAGPKWLDLPPVAAPTLVPTTLAMLAGWGVYLVGVAAVAPLAAIGLAAVAWGWSGFAWRFARMVHASRAGDRVHAKVVATGCAVGALALWLAAAGFALESYGLVYAAVSAGIWWFVAPVYAAVAHRMIPFFTASAMPLLDAWRPLWLLATWLALVALQPLLQWAGAQWPAALWLLAAVDAAGAALMLWLALRWGLVQSLTLKLLAMLHLGFVWFGVALALGAVSAALAAAGLPGLGFAPTHALTMGFLGGLMLAMVTRVSCGHGGRVLAADAFAWRLFLLAQGAVLLRLGAEWLPAASAWLMPAAALAWAGAVVPWSARHLGWYGRPRPDGRPG